jgi:hypothetical protein
LRSAFVRPHQPMLVSTERQAARLCVGLAKAGSVFLRRAGAYCRPDGKLLVIRDPEHLLLVSFVVHLLGQDAGFLGSLTPMVWVVEMRGKRHGTHWHGTHRVIGP